MYSSEVSAAVDVDQRTSDVAGALGEKEGDHVTDLFGPTSTTERDVHAPVLDHRALERLALGPAAISGKCDTHRREDVGPVAPGHTQLARTPCAPKPFAIVFVSVATPALSDAYGT